MTDDRGFVRIAGFGSEGEAREAATRLLEHGIGPEVQFEEGAGSANLLTGGSGAHVLRVLVDDAVRAREVLGVAEVDPGGEATEEAGAGPVDPEIDSLGPRTEPSALERSERETPPEKVHRLLGGRLELTTRQIVFVVAVYVSALVLIPVAFFWGTRLVLGDDVKDPPTIEVPEEP